MILIDLGKQKALDADPKTIQQINFNTNLDWDENKKNDFHYWRSKIFHKGLLKYCNFLLF